MLFTVEASACANPMSASQLSAVRKKLQEMKVYQEHVPRGYYHHKGEFKVDKCRNIWVKYGKKTHKGKLRQLHTELNFAHHDSAYFGLIPDDDWAVYDNGILVFHQEPNPDAMAKWIIEMNRKAIQVLMLAGYDKDPVPGRREKLIRHNMEKFSRPQFMDAIRFLTGVWNEANGGVGGGGNGTPAGKTYHCRLSCVASGAARVIKFKYKGTSADIVGRAVAIKGNEICRSHGYERESTMSKAFRMSSPCSDLRPENSSNL